VPDFEKISSLYSELDAPKSKATNHAADNRNNEYIPIDSPPKFVSINGRHKKPIAAIATEDMKLKIILDLIINSLSEISEDSITEILRGWPGEGVLVYISAPAPPLTLLFKNSILPFYTNFVS
jgi:hypothetical protein